MSMQDPVADMLTRIRNANSAGLEQVSMPMSKMKEAIAAVLKSEGYIVDAKVSGEAPKCELVITLKYVDEKPVIGGLERVSKSSCRVYCGSGEVPRVRNGQGSVVLSTPKGIMSGREAVKAHVGGEILCRVW